MRPQPSVKHGEGMSRRRLILKKPNEYGSQAFLGKVGEGKEGGKLGSYLNLQSPKEVTPQPRGKPDSLCSQLGTQSHSTA